MLFAIVQSIIVLFSVFFGVAISQFVLNSRGNRDDY